MNAESDRLELQSLTDRQEKFTIISSENTPSHSERRKKKRERKKVTTAKGMRWQFERCTGLSVSSDNEVENA